MAPNTVTPIEHNCIFHCGVYWTCFHTCDMSKLAWQCRRLMHLRYLNLVTFFLTFNVTKMGLYRASVGLAPVYPESMINLFNFTRTLPECDGVAMSCGAL